MVSDHSSARWRETRSSGVVEWERHCGVPEHNFSGCTRRKSRTNEFYPELFSTTACLKRPATRNEQLSMNGQQMIKSSGPIIRSRRVGLLPAQSLPTYMTLRCGKCAVGKKNPPPEHYPTRTSVGRVPEIANSVQMNTTQLEEDDPNYDTAINLAGHDTVEGRSGHRGHRSPLASGTEAYRLPPSANHHEDNRG